MAIDKKKKTLFMILAALVVAGIAAYFFIFKKKTPAQTVTTAISPGSVNTDRFQASPVVQTVDIPTVSAASSVPLVMATKALITGSNLVEGNYNEMLSLGKEPVNNKGGYSGPGPSGRDWVWAGVGEPPDGIYTFPMLFTP